MDANRLGELEIVIERGLTTFVDVGQALLEIRDKRLYRAMFLTFEDYCGKRWGMSKPHATRMIQAAQVVGAVPMGTAPPANERQARELVPLLDEPEQLRETWAEVIEIHPEPTAAHVREVVQRRIVPAPTEEELRAEQERLSRWSATMNVLDGLAHFDRDAVQDQADREAILIDPVVAASRGQLVTPARLRRAAAWATLLADAIERREHG